MVFTTMDQSTVTHMGLHSHEPVNSQAWRKGVLGALSLTDELFDAGRFKENGVVALICDPLITPPDSSD